MSAALLLDKHPSLPGNRVHETSASLPRVLCAWATSALFAITSLDHRASRVEYAAALARSFANRISAFFGLNVIVSEIVLLSFIQSEGRRLRMRLLWLPMLGTVFVGVSLGLPLFLYLRQRQFDSDSRLNLNQ